MAKTRVTDKQEEAIKRIDALIEPMKDGESAINNADEGFRLIFKAVGKNGRGISYEIKDLTADEWKAIIRTDLKKKAAEVSKLAKANDLVLEDKETALVESFK